MDMRGLVTTPLCHRYLLTSQYPKIPLQASTLTLPPLYALTHSNPPISTLHALLPLDPHVARRELEALHLFPWRKLIREAKIKGTMSSYNDYDGVPISSSSEFMIDILRTRFGFTG